MPTCALAAASASIPLTNRTYMSTSFASPVGDNLRQPSEPIAHTSASQPSTALSTLLTRSSLAAEWFARWQHNQHPWRLPLTTRRRLAVALAALDGCPNRRDVHRQRASACGLTRSEIDANERGSSQDARVERAIEFALAVAMNRGCISPDQWQRVQQAGYREPELVEIIALVGANLLEHHLGASLSPVCTVGENGQL